MPRGKNPNSLANLKKAYGGKGKFDTENARKAGVKGNNTKRTIKAARDAFLEAIEKGAVNPMDPELINLIKNDLVSAALKGDREAQKLILRMYGEDSSDIAKKKAKADLKKTQAETKKIIAETELIKLKIASPEEAEDDGFFDAIEGRMAEVWDGDLE